MFTINKNSGYTLVELMVTIGIIAVIAAIAIPTYDGYIKTTGIGAAQANAKNLAAFEETYFYENDTYLAGEYNPPGANGLAALGWDPTGDNGQYAYKVEAGVTGITNSYKITVTSKTDSTISEVITRP